jgi:transglutaminase-like putative cysteine protease
VLVTSACARGVANHRAGTLVAWAFVEASVRCCNAADKGDVVRLRVGYELVYECPQPTPMLLMLNTHYSRAQDMLSETAWQLFGHTPPGRSRVQAICSFVHNHVRFDYNCARPTKTAWQTWQDGAGVCRHYAQLAVALCRAMNIPARCCTGYISDVGPPPPYAPMDFCAWFEAYLGDSWGAFDPRNDAPRTGRILMARGRDAADVAISNTFGPSLLSKFMVVCEPDGRTLKSRTGR